MTDIHEELHTSLIQFTLLTVSPHDSAQFHLTLHILISQPAHAKEQEQINQLCPPRGMPSRMHHCYQFTLIRHKIQSLSPQLDTISAWLHIVKDDTVVISTLIHPRATIYAIFISDMLIRQTLHTHLKCEVVVRTTQVYALTFIQQALQNIITA